MGASNVVGTLLAAFMMDRVGRRPLLLFSHSAMAVCLLTMSAAQFSPGASFSPAFVVAKFPNQRPLSSATIGI